MTTDSGTPEGVSAVGRAFRILETVAEKPGIGVSDVARLCGLPKATAFRFLQTMESSGYLKTSGGGYRISMRLFELGAAAVVPVDLPRLLHDVMRDLGGRCGETVHLAVRDGQRAVYVHKIDSPHAFRLHSAIGGSIPLHCTALGKILVAGLAPSKADSLLEGLSFEKFTPSTLTTKTALKRELAIVRSAGYAEDREEHEHRIRCLAVPVFGRMGDPAAALSISAPTFRRDEIYFDGLVDMILEAGRRSSALLGFVSPSGRGQRDDPRE